MGYFNDYYGLEATDGTRFRLRVLKIVIGLCKCRILIKGMDKAIGGGVTSGTIIIMSRSTLTGRMA